MEESKVEPEPQVKKEAEVFFEGFLFLRNSYFKKTKIFGSILKDRTSFYYTKASNISDESNANNLKPVYLETSLIKSDWTLLDLNEFKI